MRPITLKIDVTKIDKTRLYKGKSGVYLDCVLFERREVGKYGDTHMILQSLSKEDRAKGIKGPIIGSATFPEKLRTQPEEAPMPEAPAGQVAEDDVPF